MQKFMCMGNLTKDPEFTTTTNGVGVARFTVAVQRKFKNKETNEYESDFFNCVAWRGAGEVINKLCKKGSGIVIIGEVQNRSYNDSDGSKRYITEVIVEDFKLYGGKPTDNPISEKKTTKDDFSDLPF